MIYDHLCGFHLLLNANKYNIPTTAVRPTLQARVSPERRYIHTPRKERVTFAQPLFATFTAGGAVCCAVFLLPPACPLTPFAAAPPVYPAPSSHLVHQQLNYSGVLEVVRIRREVGWCGGGCDPRQGVPTAVSCGV